MTEVKVMIAELRTDSKWIRKSVKEHNDKLDKISENVTKIETGFGNHLKHHDFLEKQQNKKLIIIGICVAVISILVAIGLKLILG